MSINVEKIFQGIVEKELTKEQALSLFKGIKTGAVRKSYPLSAGQKMLWIFNRLAPESYSYNVPIAYRVSSEIDITALREAIRSVIDRLPSLRTVFYMEGDNLVQEILDNPEVYLVQKDLSSLTESDAQKHIKEVSREPFNLGKGPLFKTTLFTLPEGKLVLLLNFHHIIVDGLSLQIIMDDLQQYYYASGGQGSYQAASTGANYEDFVLWQQDMLSGEAGRRDNEFWQQQLSGEIDSLNIFFDQTHSTAPTYKGASYTIKIDKPLANRIQTMSEREETTLFSAFLAAFNVLLYRYSYQEDIIVITPFVGRPGTRFDKVVGNFVNMMALRSKLSGDKEFKTLLQEIGETSLNALEHGNYPFINIVEEMQKIHKKNASQLFRVSMYMQNWMKPIFKDKVTFFLELYEGITQEGEFDLTLDVAPVEEGYRLCFKYNPDVFEEGTIIRMAGHYLQILEDVAENPAKPISNVNLLTPEEKQKILLEWNDTAAKYPSDKGVHELFEEQAERTPWAVAVIQGDRTITYRELRDRAAQIANYLQREGVNPGSLVGVYLERSIEMLAGLLGLFKAGCAFIPLDPAYPADRLSYMLENAGSRLLLTHSSIDSVNLGFSGKMIRLDTQWEEITRESTQFVNRVNPSGLAYVIYTSGSTGKPKGVQVTQKGLVNLLCSMKKVPGFSDRDKILSITSICFDIFTMELLLPLLAGGKVEIVPNLVTRDGNALRTVVENSDATFIQATPSTWRMMLAGGWKKKVPAKLLCGGEALSDELADILLQRGDELWNVYGPTEATVWSSVIKVRPGEKITIGKPIDNIQYYVLDCYMNPVPVGVPGELYIGGDGVAIGYINRPDFTSEAFVPNPFDNTGTTRLYKTGDLSRFLADGSVECLGRIDNQIKIRGFRVELGEIETALKRLEGIYTATVVLRSDSGGHKHLFAFLIREGSANEMPKQEIALNLKRWLPEYMVPSRFIYLKEFPLTPNQKLDKKYLSSASLSEIDKRYGINDNLPHDSVLLEKEGIDVRDRDIKGINGHIQKDLFDIITEILKIDKKEIDDTTNLGEFGFDSIRFTTLSDRLNKKYGINLSAAIFYEYSTIQSISAYLVSEFGGFMERSYGDVITGVNQPSCSTITYSDFAQEGRRSGSFIAGTLVDAKEPVAIIGIGGRLPQSSNLEEFWENLIENRDLITEIPENRWGWQDYQGDANKEAYKTKPICGGFLQDVDKFDASFFGISPREAELMDPQQRIFLEVAWESIEDAGYKASDLSGTKTGVFVGVAGFDYWQVHMENNRSAEGHILSGLAHSITANRVSYLLNLKGPSASIDTACSSSLVAIHRAVKAIQGGQCELAIAGGVNLMLSSFVFTASNKAGMMSGDGRCKTFGASADGYVRGEGAGALLLKPLSKAVADGDYIYAIIKGSAENHGGRTNSLTAPSPAAQAEVLVEAYQEAEVDPSTVTYIETHGTGTALGDPIEVNGLKKAFEELYSKWGKPTPVHPHCGLGSVKTNIGHLEAAAGIAGVLKVLLAMLQGKLPAVLHLKELNPQINLEGSPFYIGRENMAWNRPTIGSGEQLPRRAGVSSFGFGGSNAHIVLEEYAGPNYKAGTPICGPQVFVLSARNEDRLKAYAGKVAGYLEKRHAWQVEQAEGNALKTDIDFADMAYTLQVGREAMDKRLAIVASSFSELHDKLKQFCDGESNIDGLYLGNAGRGQETSILPIDGEEGKEFVRIIMNQKKLNKLAQIWVNGVDIDWRLLHQDRKPSRIPLPTYPFARERYWISSAVKTAAVQAATGMSEAFIHPLLHRNTSDLSEQRFTSTFTGQEFFLAETESPTLHTLQPVTAVENAVQAMSDKLSKPRGISLSPVSDAQILLDKPADRTQESINLSISSSYTSQPVLPVINDESECGSHTQAAISEELLYEELKTSLAESLYMKRNDIDIDKTFTDMGLDSIIGVEWMKSLNKQYGISIPATRLYDYPSIRKFAGFLLKKLTSTPSLSISDEIKCGSHTQAAISEELLYEELKTSLAESLYMKRNDVDIDKTFTDMGLDSIIGVEWMKSLNKQYGISIPATRLYDYPSIRKFAGFLLKELTSTPSLSMSMQAQDNTRKPEPESSKLRLSELCSYNRQSGRFWHRRKQEPQDLSDKGTVTATTPGKEPPQIIKMGDSFRDGIAIVGISGRYPDANNMPKYWDNLAGSKKSIREIPASRWDVNKYYDPSPSRPGKMYCKWMGALDDIEYFDPLFFNISPAEAEGMDPQQRIFLQEGYKAFEDAGYGSQLLSNKKCGVYLGIMSNEYSLMLHQNQAGAANTTGNSFAIAAARISYFLNLKGPAISIDTACSSSLVATHLACQALWNHEIDMALVGGVSLYLTPESYIGMCSAGMLSPDGQCKTFDNSANGFVPGEGGGALVLKRLRDAENDHDHIYGVIIGSGINQDGKTNGITAPSVNSQIELEREIYDKYNINPENISYVEMHGTGTKLGDPIELEALSTVYQERTNRKKYCAIGSVKSNIGHTSAAAGAASVQKVLLCLKNKKLAPTLNFKEHNEHFNFEDSPFYVNTELRPWETTSGVPRRAAVSSFGFSGTNAHLVIEEYVPKTNTGATAPINANNPILFVLSARSDEQLKIYAERMKIHIESDENLNLVDMAYTLQVGREPMDYRLAFLADSKETLIKTLQKFIDNNSTMTEVLTAQVKKSKDGVVVFEADEDAQSLLQTWIQKRKLNKIADLWVKGLVFDWNWLYPGTKPQRISLPTYPFARERCWIPSTAKPAAVQAAATGMPAAFIHPLLHQNTSDLLEQRFTSTFTGQEFFLADYLVKGERVLPGVAYLEMARAAVEQAVGLLQEENSGIRLRNVVWARPVAVEDQPVEVHIGLYPEEGGQIAYEIYGQPPEDSAEPVVYSQGVAVPDTAREAPALDIPRLQAECGQNTLASSRIYEVFHSMGIDYGPSHRCIEELYLGPGKVLARLALPSSVSATLDQFVLHPSLADSALQASIGLLLKGGNLPSDAVLRPAMPFALEELDLFGGCTHAMWALIRYSDGSQAGDRVHKLDIDLCDDRGKTCVRMKAFSSRVLDGELGSAVSSANLGTLMLKPCWREQPASQKAPAPDYTQRLVILCEPDSVTPEEIAAHLDKARCLALQSPQEEVGERFQAYTARTFEEIQNILKDRPKDRVLIQIVISTQDEQQLFGGLSGLLKTAQLENPKLIGQLIAVEPGQTPEAIIERLQENSWNPIANQIRYQDGKRRVAGWSEIEASPEEVIPWKDKGVYLITGGAGGLGHIFTGEITRRARDVALILTGRSALSAEKQAKLKELEASGARITYRQVDVTDEKAVADLIQSIRDEFGGLNGIIHAAGVIKDNFIIKKTREELLTVLAPKVQGLTNLDWASRDLNLDLFVLFSSAAGAIGNPGQADYAAANAFMDAYAHYRNDLAASGQRHGRTLSVNWPLWQEGGMRVDQETTKMMRQSVGMVPMQTPTGIQALYQCLASGQVQTVVMEGKLTEMRAKLLMTSQPGKIAAVSGSTTEIDTGGLLVKVQSALRQAVSKLLKIRLEDVDADTELSEYGFDQVALTEFTQEINREYGLELAPTILLEYTTICSLAKHLIVRYQNVFAKRFQKETSRKYSKTSIPQVNPELLREKTLYRLKVIFGEIIKLSVGKIEPDEPLESYGIGSIMITQLNQKLAEIFGELSKTLFYEYQTLGSLAEYLVADYQQECVRWTGLGYQVQQIPEKSVNIQGEFPVLTSLKAAKKLARGLAFIAPSDTTRESIAIIGISGRYPHAKTLNEYWENLKTGKDCIIEIPEERWLLEGFYHPDPEEAVAQGKSYSKWGGFVDGFADFDPLFFSISPWEALNMDPQERLFIETCWEVLEDAGYTKEQLAAKHHRRIGVFAGITKTGFDLYGPDLWKQSEKIFPHTSFSSVANRISYLLNLQGPSMPIDTMCSSSLTAIHEACEHLHRGECEMSIAGGVNLYLHPASYTMLCAQHMLSIDGQCKSFGQGASGFVPGEGVGCVLLKRLSQAIADQDHIYAVIRGTSINHGGKTNGYTVPNPVAQGELIRMALDRAGVDARTISYIEAHGTGTELGDPIEVTGLTQAFRKETQDTGFCAIGSVKTNIGHLEAAAGIAGVTKIMLQMKHQKIAPSLHSETLNPNIDFAGTPFVVQQELAEWKRPVVEVNGQCREYPRIAGISSFGAGGSNAHVVIEEYVPKERAPIPITHDNPAIIVLSGKNEDRLKERAERLLTAIQERQFSDRDLADIAYTLQVGREAMEERLAITAVSLQELGEKLKGCLEGRDDIPDLYKGQVRRNNETLAVFTADEDMAKAIEAWISKGKYAKLIDLWVKGLVFDWNKLYGKTKPQRIPLPTYPFARERYWVPEIKGMSGSITTSPDTAAFIHPLLQQNTSDLSEQRFSSNFTGQEFFLRDHVVQGQRVLPGVAYLEMARAAVKQATAALEEDEIGIQLKNVVWVRPVVVGEQPVRVHIGLYPEDNGEISYEIYSKPVESEAEFAVYSQGNAVLCQVTQVPVLDLPALQGRCKQNILLPGQCYEIFKAMGIEYGLGHKGIEAVYKGPDMVLAKISLPSAVSDTKAQFVLHPSLMDAALQASIGLMMESEDTNKMDSLKPSLPFALQELEVFSGCTSAMWSLIRYSEGSKAGDRIQKFDIDLCDDQGNVCVRMKGFTSRVLEGDIQANVSKAASSVTPTEPLVANMLTPVWEAVQINNDKPFPSLADRIVIVAENPDHAGIIQQYYPQAQVLEIQPTDDIQGIIRKMEIQGLIDHIVWIAPHNSLESVADEALIVEQNRGVLKCFKLIKALLRLSYGRKELGWTVITIGTQPVHKDDSVNPAHGSLYGLIGSMAMEYLHWKVRIVDLEVGHWPVEDIFTLPANTQGNPLVYRDQEWYKQELIPVNNQSTNRTLYKTGGVYVVIGGAGGIGEAWSEYMIRSYQARVIWIGRRQKDIAIQAKLDRLEGFGPAPVYIAADATDLKSLQNAYEQVKEQYTNINGVIHSAIVLHDKGLANMEEEQFRVALAAKVEVSVRIAQVFNKEPLDFVLFFSSMIAMVKSPGQSNYASGSTFKDIFAQRLSREWSCPVKVMNWGYWGSLGIVACTEYQERMAHLGVGSIESPEAMEALEKLLAGPIQQIAFAKTAKPLNGDGINSEELVTVYPDILYSHIQSIQGNNAKPQKDGDYARLEKLRKGLTGIASQLLGVKTDNIDINAELIDYGFDTVLLSQFVGALNQKYKVELASDFILEYPTLNSMANSLAEESNLKEHYPEDDLPTGFGSKPIPPVSSHMEEVNDLLYRLLLAQLQQLGLIGEDSTAKAGHKAKSGLIKLYERWFEESLTVLVRNGYLNKDNGSYTVIDKASCNIDSLWNEWNVKRQEWLKDPNMKAFTSLVEATTRNLPEILTGKKPATYVMFSNPSIVEGIYKNTPVTDYFNEVLADTIVAYVQERLKQDSQAKLRLLEIGAGTGGTSAMVFKKLKPYQDNIKEYCYTDISKAFLMHAEKEYGPDNPYLTYKIFNIELPLAGQGISEGEYDVVIAANVLHATKNIRQTLRNTKASLRKNGLLLINELNCNKLVLHLTFGLTEGWWLYEDTALRIPSCPGLYPQIWQAVLEKEGFRSVFFPAQEASELGQQIIVAESDGVVRQPQPQPQSNITFIEEKTKTRTKRRHISNNMLQQPTSQGRLFEIQKTKTMRGEIEVGGHIVENHIKETIIENLSKSLKVDSSLIYVDESFADYGLDSITGVTVVKLINDALMIELEVTSLFDYSSVNRLTAYIMSQYKEVIAVGLGQKVKQIDSHDDNLDFVVKETYPIHTQRFPRRTSFPKPYPEKNKAKDSIAIIGMSGRFAKSKSLDDFWDHLAGGKELIEEVTRWDLTKHYPAGTGYGKHGSFLDDIDQFDPRFFNISELEATYMDPQQRLFLEESWKALEDAGYAGIGIQGRQCGVYVGYCGGDYHGLVGDNPPAQAMWGNSGSVLPARIAYYLDLQGPAIAVDTACSSSLVATHLACQSLWSGETEMAIAGGIFLQCTSGYYLASNKAQMLSLTGHCYTFDDRADGFVPGEGVGVVVLKRLKEAIADGDHIHGVIRGSGINQDGATNGITAPSANSQERLECYVYDNFNINPEEIQMVEAHGTGTKLGDPIEYQALTRAFRKYTDKKEYCAIGSVKTNIGHTAAAAGIAGLIKILLSLQKKQIPPSLHFKSGNSNIQFAGSPFYVNTSLRDWNTGANAKRCAVVSSFGFSGTNAHMAIEETPELERRHSEKPGYLIVLSARTLEQLRQRVKQLVKFCEQESRVDCGNVSYTLLLGRKHFNYRLACVVCSQQELVELFKKWLEKGQVAQIYVSELHEKNHRIQPSLMRFGNQCIQYCQQEDIANNYLENLSTIAELYVQGYDLQFEQLFAYELYSRISLPTYPFVRERYWVHDNLKTHITAQADTGNLIIEGKEDTTHSKDITPSEDTTHSVERHDSENDYIASRNEFERKIVDVWKEVLGSTRVGINDRFQDLGGDSIMATQIISRLKGMFPFDLDLSSLFGVATVSTMAEVIEEALINKIEELPEEVIQQYIS